MLARLFNDFQNVLLVVAYFLQKLKCVVTAYHVVLENVIDKAYPIKDPMTEEWPDATHMLHA